MWTPLVNPIQMNCTLVHRRIRHHSLAVEDQITFLIKSFDSRRTIRHSKVVGGLGLRKWHTVFWSIHIQILIYMRFVLWIIGEFRPLRQRPTRAPRKIKAHTIWWANLAGTYDWRFQIAAHRTILNSKPLNFLVAFNLKVSKFAIRRDRTRKFWLRIAASNAVKWLKFSTSKLHVLQPSR